MSLIENLVMRILITGGAGYIGSHAVREALDQGHEVWVIDDLSHGHRKAVDTRAEFTLGNIGEYDLISNLLKRHKIEIVIHFAGFIEVSESVSDPQKYYQNNFLNGLTLLNAMKDVGVKKIVFSSTAAVYGISEQPSIDESHPLNPINPYGRSKMMMEMAIEDFAKAYGLGYSILRYFNVAGAHPDGTIGEDHVPESHLIPRVLATANDIKNPVIIYGTTYPTPDGTCIRDYVHVVDLIKAHLLAMNSISEGSGNVYNLGSEKGFSVREVVKICEQVTQASLPIREDTPRRGDPAILVANSLKARKILKWNPQYSELNQIVAHAWQWHSKHPSGYREE